MAIVTGKLEGRTNTTTPQSIDRMHSNFGLAMGIRKIHWRSTMNSKNDPHDPQH